MKVIVPRLIACFWLYWTLVDPGVIYTIDSMLESLEVYEVIKEKVDEYQWEKCERDVRLSTIAEVSPPASCSRKKYSLKPRPVRRQFASYFWLTHGLSVGRNASSVRILCQEFQESAREYRAYTRSRYVLFTLVPLNGYHKAINFIILCH